MVAEAEGQLYVKFPNDCVLFVKVVVLEVYDENTKFDEVPQVAIGTFTPVVVAPSTLYVEPFVKIKFVVEPTKQAVVPAK